MNHIPSILCLAFIAGAVRYVMKEARGKSGRLKSATLALSTCEGRSLGFIPRAYQENRKLEREWAIVGPFMPGVMRYYQAQVA
jgi:hypothetical protein